MSAWRTASRARSCRDPPRVSEPAPFRSGCAITESCDVLERAISCRSPPRPRHWCQAAGRAPSRSSGSTQADLLASSRSATSRCVHITDLHAQLVPLLFPRAVGQPRRRRGQGRCRRTSPARRFSISTTSRRGSAAAYALTSEISPRSPRAYGRHRRARPHRHHRSRPSAPSAATASSSSTAATPGRTATPRCQPRARTWSTAWRC